MKPVTIDLGVLKKSHPQLWRKVVGIHNRTGIETIDLENLKPEVADELRLLLAPPPKQEEPEVFKIDPQEAERRAVLDKREADEKAALLRLQQYASEQGLEETEQNVNHIKEWIENHSQLQGYWSVVAVDTAIAYLSREGKLTFRKPAPAAPPPPPEPVETLGWILDEDRKPTSERELPLDSSEAVLRKASITQIKNLLARRREVTGQKYIRRGHAAKF